MPGALLDVNTLVALAWDSHIHHATIRRWFLTHAAGGWATCPITESGFVRVSSNPRVLPSPIAAEAARSVMATLRAHSGHRFLTDDVSITDPDVPALSGYRQVTDAHLVTLARRHGSKLVTFDRGLAELAGPDEVELLQAVS